MKSKHKQEHSALSVMEAIETLTTIADLDFEGKNEMKVLDNEPTTVPPGLTKRVNWLEDSLKGNHRVREIFGVILNYLRNFYKNEHSYLTDPQTLEGIKGIMVLVGDAAKKIDRYATYFKTRKKGSVTQLKEYKQLNEFYRARIAHQIDEEVLGKWLLALSKSALTRQQELQAEGDLSLRAETVDEAPRHLFVNLEAVKKDTEYELFFIRKEDGSHFFSPRLLRNIKLICDFSGGEHDKDPLVDIQMWLDSQMHFAARDILSEVHEQVEQFCHEALKYKHRELVAILHKCLMALFLSSNPQNLMRENASLVEEQRKNCYSYFLDFQQFLREALHSADYHKLIAYPSEKAKELSNLLLEFTHSLCRAVYFSLHRFQDFDSHLKKLISIARAGQSSEQIKEDSSNDQFLSVIEHDYSAMSKLFKSHSRGPLARLLDALLAGNFYAFEPFAQLNIPSQLYALAVGGHKIVNLHLPSPTYQEYIHRVNVLDEFKGALRSCKAEFPPYTHLIINFQDRTSWREHFRSVALEELRGLEDIGKTLTVVTMAKDTDFYHQLSPYQQENHADVFLKHLKMHLGDENSGYYFPSTIKSAILTDFADGVMGAIHRIFFSNKNILLREHRLAFIEIFDIFLELKFLDLIKPKSFSMTCKDGVDASASSNGLLFLFLKLIDKQPLGDADWLEFNRILYAPAIIVRERLVLKERFDRMLGALKVIAFVHQDLGHELFGKVIHEAFGHYYKSPILDGTVIKVESV